MPTVLRTLRSLFLGSAETFPNRPALEVEGHVLTYAALRDRAARVAATLLREAPAADPPLTAVFAYRSPTAFAGVLGALFRGHGYVPLNRTFPIARTRTMFERSGCAAVIVDAGSEDQIPGLLSEASRPVRVLLPDKGDASALRRAWPKHSFVAAGEFEPGAVAELPTASPESIAYLLFTSGSTGIPKGVKVTHRNVVHFVDYIADLYGIREDDRFSQTFDMTFDLSAFDMFVAWSRGACVSCPPRNLLMNPGRFIHTRQLTVWFSVPSTAAFMKRLGVLKPNSYPSLRWSLFCGEPLPADSARAFSEAAPNSIVENLYGPTELTIACTRYRFDPERSPAECERGIVPIGGAFPGMQALVVDERLREVPVDGEGELILAGPQVSAGYWNDAQKTADAFVVPPGREEVYYRTGDRVRRPRNAEPLRYLGRMDHQIKVLGHRVELGEVEAALREVTGETAVVALGWPLSESGAEGVVAFVARDTLQVEETRAALARRLPGYMVPREIRLVAALPLNPNGKVDRNRLLDELRRPSADASTARKPRVEPTRGNA